MIKKDVSVRYMQGRLRRVRDSQGDANGDCDAMSMARPLIANNDLVKQFAARRDQAERPCTYCNRCLVHVVQDPLGCYEESRFPNRDAMLEEVMSVFQPPAFS